MPHCTNPAPQCTALIAPQHTALHTTPQNHTTPHQTTKPHHTTPHHTTPHHTTPHHTTPHHTTPHHTTPHHTTPHHTTPHHTTPHHTTPHRQGPHHTTPAGQQCPEGVPLPHCLCVQAVRQCTEGVLLPTGPQQRGSVLKDVHCPLLPGSAVVHSKSPTGRCPQAGSTAHNPLHWGSQRKDPHRPLPVAAWQCTQGSQPPMSWPQNRLTRARRCIDGGNTSSTIRQRGRGHRAALDSNRLALEGQPSATGAQHTTKSAHLDTQPSRLAFSRVQDHPDHCLSVTAPSAHHTTPHHTTPHHTTPHHTTPHHTTPHHTTPHHTTPHHTTPHHTTPHHTTPHPLLSVALGTISAALHDGILARLCKRVPD